MFKRLVNLKTRFTGRLYFAISHGHAKIPFKQHFVCWALKVWIIGLVVVAMRRAVVALGRNTHTRLAHRLPVSSL